MKDETKAKKVAGVAVQVTAEELKERIMTSLVEGVERTYLDEDGEEITSGLGGLLNTVNVAVVKAVKEEFEGQIQEVVQRAITEAVKAQIDSGLFTVGKYGERQPKTLNQLIQEELQAVVSSDYGEPRRTRAEHVVVKSVEKALQTELAAEVKQLREAFAAQVKAKLSAAAGEAISRAMGVY